jgi:hypothetical protein
MHANSFRQDAKEFFFASGRSVLFLIFKKQRITGSSDFSDSLLG